MPARTPTPPPEPAGEPAVEPAALPLPPLGPPLAIETPDQVAARLAACDVDGRPRGGQGDDVRPRRGSTRREIVDRLRAVPRLPSDVLALLGDGQPPQTADQEERAAQAIAAAAAAIRRTWPDGRQPDVEAGRRRAAHATETKAARAISHAAQETR